MTSPIGPIPTLPVFFKLKDRRVLLGGGNDAAVWKAQLLCAAGARVLVCDPEPSAAMRDLAAGAHAAITLALRRWQSADFQGAALAIGALPEDEGEAFRDAARTAGVPVNIVDVPRLCDFQFGTLLSRGPLIVAISTDGAAPVLAQALRTRFESLLPEELEVWVEAAQAWRLEVARRGFDFAARRRFWEVFADRALDGSGAAPSPDVFAACLSAAEGSTEKKTGRLTLVGLGPGDADLLTLRAVRALQSADVILHPPTVPAAIIGLGRREAMRATEPAQNEESLAMVKAWTSQGRAVAWIGYGDPVSGASWSDRRKSLRQADLEVAMVPGLPAP